ncbi:MULTISPECIES: beta-galactosidase family protein [Vagococcus]|uniref:glycoside hydrolase family 35 protein n=1 Tax=Vagococcus TaxID=2737 RepID=UPI000E488A3D|nr:MULTISPECIES: beta-galactosidase family protein [Vagococcus]RHH67818.1 beta-galactosidase [Vagococcus sp. AM17-17]
MQTFEIKEDFLLDGKPIKIISGAIHYFRMTQNQWEDSLYNLKALGANTVETYIPWNIHEPIEGTFDFNGMKDVVAFVKLAQEMGLYVILRPSVYICAEWEFGGLPAWLLKDGLIRLRSTDKIFMEKVENYYHELLPKLRPLQVTQGGPVIMMQIENEYGSYGMEKEYLLATKKIVESYGIDIPLFTSDGSWTEVLDAGSLIDEDVFVAGNFGSQSLKNAAVLKDFMTGHNKKWPIISMEYWDGWFNRWGNDIIKRDPQDLADEVEDMLSVGSINLYMFHGGTNFGFYNGCSARGNTDLPQVTSYDYDALLNESGQPTEKYYLVQKAIKKVCPDVWQAEPRVKELGNLGSFPIDKSVSLFHTKDDVVELTYSSYPLTMEQASSGYGYLLYDFELKNYHHENKFKIIEASDRLKIYADESLVATQYQETNGEELMLQGNPDSDTIHMDILVENLGRVNYGYKLNNPTQMKGIRGGVMYDIHFHQGFKHYPLTLSKEQLDAIDFDKEANPSHPSFYQSTFNLENVKDTYIDCSAYGKGVVIVNGINLGRYWDKGPHLSLYCPKEFLNVGENDIIIFETEGKHITNVTFSDTPVYV